ncbi:hypothetical protein Patl1_07312 [Pistacia atlantica]|uniref:Uncharacterized protein n=1 Tax=Pistacia atlantica TaxID=434234 RepID=A0ACC1ALE9_9ROSI|nr:hypothetical protein Patl1_07312 [Pistacia atlantica]
MSQNLKSSPSLPWKPWFLMNFLAYIVDASRRPNITVNRRLFNLFDLKSPPSKNPINAVATLDIVVDTSRDLWFRLYTPEKGGGDDVSMPVIFYLHGGGFCYLQANSFSFDRYPSQCEDGIDVLKFVDTTNIERFPSCANLKHCYIVGDNAGGNLAHQVALRATQNNFLKLEIIGLIAIQPLFGGEERTESEIRLHKSTLLPMERTDWMWKALLPKGSNKDHPAVNIFGPNAVDISDVKFPATIVFVGGLDTLQDWQKRYYEGLKKSGKEAYLIEYPNAVHSFYSHPEIP